MFPQDTILGPLFWIVLGLIYALVIAGASIWFKDLGFKMNWWKWLVAGTWFALLSLTIGAGFTLIGEDEFKAGYYFLGVFGMICLISGVGVWRLLSHKKM